MFKTVRLMAIRNRLKQTISVDNGLWLLQMVLEGCASEDNRALRGVDCKIPHWLERGTKHSF